MVATLNPERGERRKVIIARVGYFKKAFRLLV